MVPSAPAVSRAAGFPAGPRIGSITSAAATVKTVRGSALDGPSRGVGVAGGTRNIGAPSDNSRSFRGGGGDAIGLGQGSSASRAVDEQQPPPPATRRPSDAGQVIGGRRARERRGGGRKRSTSDLIAAATTAGGGTDATAGSVKGGTGRGKGEGGRTRPRRASSQVSFGSSTGEGGGGGDGCFGGDHRAGGGVRRGEAGERGGRTESGTEDHKFRMQAGQSNTLVAVRLRPLLKHDREQVEVAKVSGTPPYYLERLPPYMIET